MFSAGWPHRAMLNRDSFFLSLSLFLSFFLSLRFFHSLRFFSDFVSFLLELCKVLKGICHQRIGTCRRCWKCRRCGRCERCGRCWQRCSRHHLQIVDSATAAGGGKERKVRRQGILPRSIRSNVFRVDDLIRIWGELKLNDFNQ